MFVRAAARARESVRVYACVRAAACVRRARARARASRASRAGGHGVDVALDPGRDPPAGGPQVPAQVRLTPRWPQVPAQGCIL